ncbi:hypothetical protein J2792_004074 [Novosphingobium capsulatum]|uniref:Excalibur calcium-binding domain-containing protein n=1 Tax=Novosphingobium capsulatum TaxID=13688 RepID=A0ABU1MT04_9SPHN|nr:excalibur calcium-binding domain-containing protein [Novosphingobium capsulatum]MDR6513182.1 hypothetical protein [Novosphingobium capsulatum]
MSFKKPFRAVPIRPGERYRNHRPRSLHAGKMSNVRFALLACALSAATVGSTWFFSRHNPSPAGEWDLLQSSPDVYYADCNAARAAGVTPIHKGQAGYRTELDADADGIACEPYRKW